MIVKSIYKLVFIILSFLTTTYVFSQDLNDNEIGLNVSRITIELKEQGLKEEEINNEIVILREKFKLQHLEMKKVEDSILNKIQSDVNSKRNPLSRGGIVDIPQIEKEALLSLYNSTEGKSWIDKTGWDFNTPVTSWNRITKTGWYGVTVDADGHVAMLDFVSNSLKGPIPPEIGNLTSLLSLVIKNSQLGGSIPPEIGNLNNLKYLDISSNYLEGNIPSSIGQLEKLQTFLALYNRLTKIPPEIGQLKNLITLDLSSNMLSGIPSEIGDLTNLSSLNFYRNKLKENIPREIGKLKNLTMLDLNWNKLTGNIPSEIGQLSNLMTLVLPNNKLSGSIPSEIGDLTKLKKLVLMKNELTGSIPVEIAKLSNLTSLDLGGNQLTGSIPKELAQLKNLTYLLLGSNKLTGSIPPELGELINLTNLSLRMNQLTGTIPIKLNQLKKIYQFNFSENQLSGRIPSFNNVPKTCLFSIYSNSFRFADLEANYESLVSTSYISYAPQLNVDKEQTILVTQQNSVNLVMFEDGQFTLNDTFQWYKGIYPKGVVIPNATSRVHTISNFQESDAGEYYCLSKNTVITNASKTYQNLIMVRNPIKLKLSKCEPITGIIKLVK